LATLQMTNEMLLHYNFIIAHLDVKSIRKIRLCLLFSLRKTST